MGLSLRAFLQENTDEFQLDKVADTLANFMKPSMLAKVEPFIATLKTAIADGTIYNVDYEAIKASFGRVADTYNQLYYNPKDPSANDWYKYDNPNSKLIDSKGLDLTPYVDGGNYKKQVKHLAAASKLDLDANIKVHFEDMTTLLDAFAHLHDALKSMKDKVVKGRKPAVRTDDHGFSNRMGSDASQALIKDHLIAGITPALDKYEARVIAYFESEVASLNTHDAITAAVLKSNPTLGVVLSSCFTFDTESFVADNRRQSKFVNLKLNANYRDWIIKEAASMRKGIEAGFIDKNLRKLSMIVDKKGNLDSIAEIPHAAPKVNGIVGAMEAAFIFKFKDNSSFEVTNKITVNYTAQGKGFNQFPTTFHDVKLPDGSRLSFPSEEKMVTTFVS